MKKKAVYFLVILNFLCYICRAQDSLRRESAVESLKIAFISKRLNLMPDEAQKFWPIYNMYSAELKTVRRLQPQNDVLLMEEHILNIRKKYKADFLKVLSLDRLNTFYKSERDFIEFLHKHLENRKYRKEENEIRK